MMIDPNTSQKEISDDDLIAEFKNPKKYRKALLYSLMAMRANKNNEIKILLFDFITDEKNRNEYFLGTLIHAWLPVLHILDHGTPLLKSELKEVLKKWPLDERESFLNYVYKEESYRKFLEDIINT
ncbi:MAG: hypothetical protein AAFP19_01480 [Bacteroidota bacterium]